MHLDKYNHFVRTSWEVEIAERETISDSVLL